jgi:hypothetical protein
MNIKFEINKSLIMGRNRVILTCKMSELGGYVLFPVQLRLQIIIYINFKTREKVIYNANLSMILNYVAVFCGKTRPAFYKGK